MSITDSKAYNRSWDLWLTKYISTNLISFKYEIIIIKFHIFLHMCGHGFVVHHLETLQDILLHIFLNWGKYLFSDCHTTNHNNHNKILEYSSQLPSEYEHHPYLIFTWGTSTSYTGSSGARETSNSVSPCKCESHNMGIPSCRIMLIYILISSFTHESK